MKIVKQINISIYQTIYEPSRGWSSLNLRELWNYRELLYFLTKRDIKVRYTQAALGLTWAVIQPLLTMVIFSVIFGRFANLPSDDIPYPIFTFTALLPWQLFASSLQRAGTSLVSDRNLITKVYFPRLMIPMSAVTACVFDFGISLIVLLVLMIFYRITPTWAILTIPFLVLYTMLTAMAVSLWLSALNVQYRDVEHTIPFIVQAWMYASPVAYSTALIPNGLWQILYGLNPMAGVIQGFRWALLGSALPDKLMLVSFIIVFISLIGGLYYFKHMEKTFADLV